ncbi:MAG: hypothetical protein ACPLSA_01915, partial [Caldanaerobacter sp.]
MHKNREKIIWSIFIVSIIAAFFIFSNNNNENQYLNSRYSGFIYQESDGQKVLTRDEAISNYWDEIKDYINGIETIEACSWKSGNCYSVDADISGGVINTIYFDNGGYLDFSADIDEYGNAWDFDQNLNDWDFTIDMDSPIIEDAINKWADD